MRMIRVSAMAVLMASCAGGAMATDFGEMAPSTDWNGFYAGILGGVWDGLGYADVQGVVGVNFMPSEMFLIGIEGSVGAYIDIGGGGGSAAEAQVGVRAGVALDQALLFATAGEWTDGGGFYAYVGGGAEFMASDNMSIRAQVIYFPGGGDFLASAGLIWHMP